MAGSLLPVIGRSDCCKFKHRLVQQLSVPACRLSPRADVGGSSANSCQLPAACRVISSHCLQTKLWSRRRTWIPCWRLSWTEWSCR